ncbi:MAG: hypothetical protein LBI60_00895, partial [Bacteroidales bacterium]|nr:hypothetical protein [Bacteroidales bacterium]
MKIILCACLSGLMFYTFIACRSSAKEVETNTFKENETEKISPALEEIPTVEISEEQLVRPITISSAQFMKLVSDFHKAWKYKGKKPCVVDFYADWCRPCKMMEPALAKMAQQYA